MAHHFRNIHSLRLHIQGSLRLLLQVLKELWEAAALFEGHAIGELRPWQMVPRWFQAPRRGFSQCSTLSGTDSMWKFLATGLQLVPLIGTATNSNHHGGVFFLFLAMSFLAKFPCVCAISLNRFSSVLICVGSTSILCSCFLKLPTCSHVWLRSTDTSWINDLYWGRKQKGSPL